MQNYIYHAKTKGGKSGVGKNKQARKKNNNQQQQKKQYKTRFIKSEEYKDYSFKCLLQLMER